MKVYYTNTMRVSSNMQLFIYTMIEHIYFIVKLCMQILSKPYRIQGEDTNRCIGGDVNGFFFILHSYKGMLI